MRLRVEGRLRVVTFATALPPLKVVTVTLLTTAFLAGALRVLVLRAGFATVDLETVAVGIRDLRLYSLIINTDRPIWTISLHNETKFQLPSCQLY